MLMAHVVSYIRRKKNRERIVSIPHIVFRHCVRASEAAIEWIVLEQLYNGNEKKASESKMGFRSAP